MYLDPLCIVYILPEKIVKNCKDILDKHFHQEKIGRYCQYYISLTPYIIDYFYY